MKKILFLLTAICLFAACDKKDSEQGSLSIGTAVTITSAEFSPTGSDVQFAISAESNWSISGPAWVTFTPSSGRRGTTEVTMRATLNRDEVDRSGQVIVALNNDSRRETIEVFQATPYLNIDRWTIPYTWDYSQSFSDTPEMISLTSNIDWRLDEVSYTMAEAAAVNRYAATAPPIFTEQLADVLTRWLVCSVMEGMGDAALTFIPATYNISDAPYELVLRLSGPYIDGFNQSVEPIFEHLLTFSQANLRFLVDITDSENDQWRDFKACNNAVVPITVNSELNWRVQSKPDWVTVTPDAGNGSASLSTSQFAVPEANPTREQRTGEIVIVSEAGTSPLPERVITVQQQPYVFYLGSSASSHANIDDAERSIEVYSSGAWQVDPASVPEWVVVSKNAGDGIEYWTPNDSFVYNIPSQNLELNDRTATLRVQSVEPGNTLAEEFSIRQNAFIFEASFGEILTMSTDYHSGYVNSSGDWAITSVTYDGSPVKDWLEFDSMTGNAGGTYINYRATSINTSDEDRVAQVTVRSLTHERAGVTLEQVYEIKQRKYTFELTPASGTSFSDVAYWTSSHAVTLDASVNWTVETPDWVNASAYEGAGSTTLYFTLNPNTEATSRSGEIKITGMRNDTFTYPITQSAYTFSTDAQTTYNVPVEPSTFSFEVLSSGPWSIVMWEGDTAFSPSSGDGRDRSATVTATTAWNASLSERTMRFHVGNDASGVASEIFTIVQAPYEFDSTPESFDYPTLNPSQSTVNVVCSGAWVLQNVPAWITVAPTSGTGNATLTITPQNNVNTTSRSATFRVYSSIGGYTKEITVSQDAYEFDSSSESYAYAALETKTNTINVTSTGAWSVVNAPSWLNFSKTSGASSDSFTITSTHNTSASARSATFYVQADLNTSLRKQITVSQDPYIFEVDQPVLSYNALAGVYTDFTLTSTGGWTASTSQSWLTLSKTSGTGNATITATITTVNPTASQRTATITLTSTDDASRKVTIDVYQQGYEFVTNTTALTMNALAGAAANFTLTSTGDWMATTSESWLKLDKTSGTGNATLTATISTVNPTASQRTATITLTSKDDLNRKVTINVTQQGYEFTTNTTAVSVANTANSTGQVTLTSSGSWTATSNQSWLTASPASGASSATVTLTATSANTATSTRSATVTFKSSDDANRTVTVTVTQAAAPAQNQ